VTVLEKACTKAFVVPGIPFFVFLVTRAPGVGRPSPRPALADQDAWRE
jgi:hypothetical protein